MLAVESIASGEQRQLALAMVLMRKPKLLILDEPSAGLSPGSVIKLYEIPGTIKKEEKIGILLIEQNVKMAFEFSDELLLLKEGLIEKQAMSLENIEEKYFE